MASILNPAQREQNAKYWRREEQNTFIEAKRRKLYRIPFRGSAHIRIERVCFRLPTCKLDFLQPTVRRHHILRVRNLRSNRRRNPWSVFNRLAYWIQLETMNCSAISRLIWFTFSTPCLSVLWAAPEDAWMASTREGLGRLFVRLLIRTPVECLIGNLVVGQIVIIHERLVE